MSVLDRIVAVKRDEVAALGARRNELRAAALDAPPTQSFGASLQAGDTVRVIAEIKRRSPSAGWIRDGASAPDIATAYAAHGAAALSVLTDAVFFGGSLDDLRAVRAQVELPLLRKDFIIDEAQIHEARCAGADAVLLIVRILSDTQLGELLGVAAASGLDALVEVHDRTELARAAGLGARLVGVNSRDLATFRTDLAAAHALAAEAPAGCVLVAESGIREAADVAALAASGFDAILVGERLMRAPDPGEALAQLARTPRRSRRGQSRAAAGPDAVHDAGSARGVV